MQFLRLGPEKSAKWIYDHFNMTVVVVVVVVVVQQLLCFV